jgi:hypothetical protein
LKKVTMGDGIAQLIKLLPDAIAMAFEAASAAT